MHRSLNQVYALQCFTLLEYVITSNQAIFQWDGQSFQRGAAFEYPPLKSFQPSTKFCVKKGFTMIASMVVGEAAVVDVPCAKLFKKMARFFSTLCLRNFVICMQSSAPYTACVGGAIWEHYHTYHYYAGKVAKL